MVGLVLALVSGILLFSRQRPSDARLIAHSDLLRGNSDIYLKIPGSSHLKNLTRHPAIDTQPTWSPDGEWITFVSERDTPSGGHPVNNLYVMRRDGTQLRRLGVSSPATGTRIVRWSPDGAWIYTKYITRGWWDNYFVRLEDGSTSTLRFNNTFTVYASWSPRDLWLAFRTETLDGRYGIFLARPTAGAPDIQPLVMINFPIDKLVWSPDGKKLAFTVMESAQYALYQLDVQGKTPQLLLTHPLSPYSEVIWSLDSQQLALITENGLTLIGVDGSPIYFMENMQHVAWSPDGQWLIASDEHDHIHRLRPDGSARQRIHKVQRTLQHLAWEGQWIYFRAGDRNQEHLYRMRPDGSDVTYLTETAFDWDIPLSPIIDLPWRGWEMLFLGVGGAAVSFLRHRKSAL